MKGGNGLEPTGVSLGFCKGCRGVNSSGAILSEAFTPVTATFAGDHLQVRPLEAEGGITTW